MKRSPAKGVLAATAATVAYGLVLLLAFDPGVEMLDAAALVERRDDARAFLIADLLFPVIYGVLLPLALWRFDRGWWGRAAALLFAAGGLVDWVENGLLLSATGSASQGTVDAAHAAGIVNVVVFTLALLPGLLLTYRAIRELRRQGR